MLLVVVAGLGARLLAATRGHNYDVDSDQIISDIVNHGGNVYAATTRYNYGPVWFNILHALSLLARHNAVVLRYFIAGFLALVDVGIFFVLRRRFGNLVAALFFLNPVSILITGYHSQFDNLAVLLGLLAMLLVGDEFDRPLGRRKYFGLIVLGISLTTKHLLFVFPFWLAIKQKGFFQKLAMVLTPLAVFALSFVPYWHEGKQGIIRNVFSYRSFTNDFFYNLFVPQVVQFILSDQTVWFLMLGTFAFICRQKRAVESLLFYTCVLVVASPAVANQYLAIPVPFIAVQLFNPFTILFTFFATLHLLVNVDGLHLVSLSLTGYADIAICFLCFGLVWSLWRQNLIALLQRIVLEVKNQFDLK